MSGAYSADHFGSISNPELESAFARIRTNDATGESELQRIFGRGAELLIRRAMGDSVENELAAQSAISALAGAIRDGRVGKASDIACYLWLRIRRVRQEPRKPHPGLVDVPEKLFDFVRNLRVSERMALSLYCAGEARERISDEAGISMTRVREIQDEARSVFRQARPGSRG